MPNPTLHPDYRGCCQTAQLTATERHKLLNSLITMPIFTAYGFLGNQWWMLSNTLRTTPIATWSSGRFLAVESTNFHLACAMAHRHTLLAVHVSLKGLPLPSYAIFNSKLAKCSLIVGLAFQWDVSGGHVGILIGLGSGIYGLLGTDHSLSQ